ncbi:PPOX class F420-dependent enzyme [Saccharomonospora sp. CUA-673]|uniref:PPOX class F420-dependent oxidoreductase n=1 Tax=Saccharomonospora sp. CUA-673 TaxID=1904969 RepID=UPI00095B74E3|nr:PPOX class F420-dependent oxidoreductase [Saccharomonospora sp. CUA-673]OLT48535.1 PPOX class F420-dependent enzyme [Saccharomonospora sp. CUA-673]
MSESAENTPETSTAEQLGAEKYVLLTTFRRSGTPVPTPVWIAPSDGELVVFSERNAGKVKRIRAGADVELTACDMRGTKTHGPAVRGTARVLDHEGSVRTRTAIARKYGLFGRLVLFGSRLRGGTNRTVGIAIRVAE